MKGIIRQVSSIDSSGSLEVLYDIIDDKSKVLYPDLRVWDRPENVKECIRRKLADLGATIEAVKTIKVGDIITI